MYDVTTAKLFLLDMDGTFYLDDTLLPGALEFLALCRATGRQFAFLTNNSSKSKADYLAKLTRLGADVTEHDIFTSGDATLLYLAENGFPKDILLIGTPSLEAQFAAEGYTVRAAKPRAVVLGFDTTITYDKLRLLCDAVRAGLPYIATHPDYNCPVAGGFIPDIGAVIAFVKASTGRDPDAVIGKPNAYIARAAAHKYGVSLKDVCMVGDRLYTDIALGACGCDRAGAVR
ncbi:MAG: HAD-IIA family hydrolase [Ruthenibacterium lactatiformans]